MAAQIFSGADYQWIANNCNALRDCHVKFGDKPAVEEDQFVVTEGGFTQSFKRTFWNCLKGGYNREAVVAHFEKLWTKVHEFTNRFRVNLNDRALLRESKIFAKQLYLLKIRASDFEWLYRSHCSFRDDTSKKLESLYEQFRGLSRSLNEALQIEGASLDELPYDMPQEQTVAETLELANRCVVSISEKVSAYTTLFFALLFLSFPCWVLSIPKWLIWNPIEFLIRGKITTQSPLLWLFFNAKLLFDKQREKERQYAQYTNQLLHTSIITEEHVNAFHSLATKADLKEIWLAGFSTHPERGRWIDPANLLRLIDCLRDLPFCRKISIPNELIIARERAENNSHLLNHEDFQTFLRVDAALQRIGFRPAYGIYVR